MPIAEILSQGNEVITGQITDTNAPWLAQKLTDLGFDVSRHTTVGDQLHSIQRVISQAAERADFVICSGGLGPTKDDLTAEAAALAMGTELVFDKQAMQQIEKMFALFNRRMPKVNEKQAWLPKGSTRLDNFWGTAPGFAMELSQAWCCFVPGVPREMMAMYENTIEPELKQRFSIEKGRHFIFRTTGIGESDLQELLHDLVHEQVELGFRASFPEVQVKLKFPPRFSELSMVAVFNNYRERLGDFVFSIEGLTKPNQGGDMAEVIGRQLKKRNASLAVAESCTGGRVAAALTAVPGSSSWLKEGAVTYSNESKIRQLKVDSDTLSEVGAVSAEVACQMAQGIREASGAEFALATTGIAGPDGGSKEKPVGTVFIALAADDNTFYEALNLIGDRHHIQASATMAALNLLRLYFLDHPIDEEMEN